MNIVREQREAGVSLIKVVVGSDDYTAGVEKMLRDYRRQADIPGFRKGNVPMGVVKKMYGKGVLAEQSYQAASKGVFDYLKAEGIDYVGDVIPSEEQGDFDFDNGTEFEFVFEIGQAPAYTLELTKKNKISYKVIEISEQIHNDYRTNYLRRYGRLVDVEEVTSDEALTVTLDNGDMKVEDAYVGLISMSEEERAPFAGLKKGSKMSINVNELYKTPSQRAAILSVEESELEALNPEFEMEVTNIRKFADPEMNEEFFKMAFPEGNITSEAELDAFLDEQIAVELRRESDYMFGVEMSKYVQEKANIQMPEAFLKRWLMVINEGKFTQEDIDKDFDAFLKMFTWNYIQKQVIEAEKITVTPEEALAEAKSSALMQFAQYGMANPPEDMLENYAQQMLSDKQQAPKIYEKLMENKVVEALKAKITVTEQTMSADDFTKHMQTLQ